MRFNGNYLDIVIDLELYVHKVYNRIKHREELGFPCSFIQAEIDIMKTRAKQIDEKRKANEKRKY